VRPVCGAIRDGLLDGILDCLVTGLVIMARRVPGGSARPAGGEGGRLLAQGRGETGQSPGAACYAEPTFQPGHGGLADAGQVGELFLGQVVLDA
jgi:hypothetical protein